MERSALAVEARPLHSECIDAEKALGKSLTAQLVESRWMKGWETTLALTEYTVARIVAHSLIAKGFRLLFYTNCIWDLISCILALPAASSSNAKPNSAALPAPRLVCSSPS